MALKDRQKQAAYRYTPNLLSVFTDVSDRDGSKTTIWTASQTLDNGEVNYMAVTITAGLTTSTNKNAAGSIIIHMAGVRKDVVVVAIAQLVACVLQTMVWSNGLRLGVATHARPV